MLEENNLLGLKIGYIVILQIYRQILRSGMTQKLF